jgi:hypothetical protein
MHLSIKKFIDTPQRQNKLPTRLAIFVDLTNMFNAVSREELLDVINADFPELSPLTSLFYAEEGNVLFKEKQEMEKVKNGRRCEPGMPTLANLCNISPPQGA